MFHDKTKLTGIVERRLFDKDGNPKAMFRDNWLWALLNKVFHVDLQIPFITGVWTLDPIKHNTITAKGKEAAQKLLTGQSANAMTYIALGTGSPAANALGAEITDSGLQRAAATISTSTTTTTNDTAELTKTFSATGSKAVTEEGILDAASSGNMGASQSFSAVNLVSGDSLQITHKLIAG